MKFRPYTPKAAHFPVKFYSTEEGIALGKRGGSVVIDAPDQFTARRVEKFLSEYGVDINNLGLRELGVALQQAGLIQIGRNPCQQTAQQPYRQSQRSDYDSIGQEDIAALVRKSGMLDLRKPPFRDSTLSEVSVLVSSNEPPQIATLFSKTKLRSVHSAHLPVADIVATNDRGDTLFIERKTVRDLYQSVTQHHHSHDQSERMFDEVMALRKAGSRAMAIWLIEALPNGPYLVAESLPQIQNVDGLLNYFTMINEQPVFQTYSTHHTVYMAAKCIQGFFEQKLFYPIKTTNPAVNRSKKERLAAKDTSQANPNATTRGVVRHTSDSLQDILAYLPGFTTRSATTLAQTGRTLAEITQMSEQELLSIKGIGPKNAKRIYHAFHTNN